ncbi:MAG: DUF4153 domain-containing protein [Bacteroidales bacterium]
MKLNLEEFRSLLLRVILKTPAEVILSLLFFILSLYIEIVLGNRANSLWMGLRNYFCVCFGVAYACNFIFHRGKVRIFYYGTLLLPVLYYFYLSYTSVSFFVPVVTTLCVVLFMLFARGVNDNARFTYSSISMILNLGMVCALAIASILAMMSILQSINYIFGVINNTEEVESTIVSLGIFVIAPFLFLLFEQTPYSKEVKGNHFFDLLFNYILIPAILIYGAILYAYFTKIIILWTLPKGVISATAIAFLAGGFIIKAGRVILNHKSANWFFDYLPFISLPAIGMLWVSSMVRILEYGFTGDRLYLLLAVIVLTVVSLAPLCKRLNVYRYLLAFTMVTFLIFTYVPGIKADDLDKKAKAREGFVKKAKEMVHIDIPRITNVDIGGFNAMYTSFINYAGDSDLQPHYKVRDGYLFIWDKNNNLLFKKSCDELLSTIFLKAGVIFDKKIEVSSVEELKSKLSIYKDENSMILLDCLVFALDENGLSLQDVSIDFLFMK